MDTTVHNETEKTEKPAEPVPAGKAAAEEEGTVPADRHRILQIVVLAWAALTVIYGMAVLSGIEKGYYDFVQKSFFFSWPLMECRKAYGIAVVAEGFLLLAVWTRLHGLRKDGPVWLTAFFVLSFFVYLVYRIYLGPSHSGIDVFDSIAYINLGCTAAMIAGSWMYRERAKDVYVR